MFLNGVTAPNNRSNNVKEYLTQIERNPITIVRKHHRHLKIALNKAF